jgi:hypothetical protein
VNIQREISGAESDPARAELRGSRQRAKYTLRDAFAQL